MEKNKNYKSNNSSNSLVFGRWPQTMMLMLVVGLIHNGIRTRTTSQLCHFNLCLDAISHMSSQYFNCYELGLPSEYYAGSSPVFKLEIVFRAWHGHWFAQRLKGRDEIKCTFHWLSYGRWDFESIFECFSLNVDSFWKPSCYFVQISSLSKTWFPTEARNFVQIKFIFQMRMNFPLLLLLLLQLLLLLLLLMLLMLLLLLSLLLLLLLILWLLMLLMMPLLMLLLSLLLSLVLLLLLLLIRTYRRRLLKVN